MTDNAPHELEHGGYDKPPRESTVVAMVVDAEGVYAPRVVVDPYGFEWIDTGLSDDPDDHAWRPTGRLAPSKVTHEWGAVTHDR